MEKCMPVARLPDDPLISLTDTVLWRDPLDIPNIDIPNDPLQVVTGSAVPGPRRSLNRIAFLATPLLTEGKSNAGMSTG
jgi:hypothetical protein